MRKSKFLAMTLAVALVAGAVLEAPVAVRAEETAAASSELQEDSRPSESQGDSRPSESQGDAPTTVDFELVAPDEVGWEDGWVMHYILPNKEALDYRDGNCRIRIYMNGDTIYAMGFPALYGEEPNAKKWIMETGDYTFSATELAMVDGQIQESEEVFAASRHYDAPAQRLAKVQGVEWDQNETGIVYFTPVEGDVEYYGIRGYHEYEENREAKIQLYEYCGFPEGSTRADGAKMWQTEDGRIAVDLTDFIRMYGEDVYYVDVQAFSKDIDTTANGYPSEMSAALDTHQRAITVADKITEAIGSKTPEEAVKAIQNDIKLEELATNMQTDANVLSQIKGLEESYKQATGITVEQNVSEEVQRHGVDLSRVSIVGAAFNAQPNSTVSLNIDFPDVPVVPPEGYLDAIQLDIKLNNLGNSISSLEMPITITMPVPAEVEPAKLILWHYHLGDRTQINFKDNGDGTITFTVTDFSVFVFTKEKTNTQTGSDSTANNSNSSSSSSTSSTQTVTEEKKAPVAIEYVVKRGDSMAKIARRHGLTLGQLIALNPQVKNPARIYAGQILIVGYTNGEAAATDAVNAEYYIVQRGDSLFKIAVKNKLTLLELKVLNPELFAQRYIFAGQKVRVK